MCGELKSGDCCYDSGSLWGSARLSTSGIGNPTDYLATVHSLRGEDNCGIFVTSDQLNSCILGGFVDTLSGISFDPNALAMDEPKSTGAEKRRPHVQAEMAIVGKDVIYIISDAKRAELEAQGLGRPDDKQERVEWFKKHYTKKLPRGETLAFRKSAPGEQSDPNSDANKLPEVD